MPLHWNITHYDGQHAAEYQAELSSGTLAVVQLMDGVWIASLRRDGRNDHYGRFGTVRDAQLAIEATERKD